MSIGSRICRKRLLLKKDPSNSIVNKLLQSSCGSMVRKAASECHSKSHVTWPNQHSIDMIIHWLRSSCFIKQSQQLWQASRSFAKIFASSNHVSIQSVMGSTRKMNYQVLRAARVRIDFVACRLFRQLYRKLPSNIGVFMFVDSSPQVVGQELFAASFELYDPDGRVVWERRLMPLLALMRDFLDAVGKAMAMLWLIWLLVGPRPDDVIQFCSQIRCLVTDMGTERLIARMVDMVPAFFEEVFDYPRGSIPARPSMFPLCLQSPGWMHTWDIVLRRGLASMSFFPSFIEGLRAVIKFLRSKLWIDQLCRKLRQKQLFAPAEMIESVTVPSIAEWRWVTLHLAMKSINAIISTFATYWDPSVFANSKEPKTMKAITKALTSVAWRWQFKYVMWFCNWICTIQQWGQGSRERDLAKESDDSVDVDPMMQGRRLAESGRFVEEQLQMALDEISEWDLHRFGPGCSFESLDELKRAVRYSHVLATMKSAYLHTLPALLARLLEPGIRDKCLDLYRSCNNHHPLSDMYLSEDSALLPHVLALTPGGGNVSAILHRELDILWRTPFDDSVCERPHAVGNSIARHAKSCGFDWVASSMRLSQNLTDVPRWCEAMGLDLEQEWLKHTSVLQSSWNKRDVPVRLPNPEVKRRFYMMGQFSSYLHTPVVDHDDEDIGADPNNNDDQPGLPDRVAAHPCDELSARAGDAFVGEAKHVQGDESLIGRHIDAQELGLIKDFMIACLQPGMYVSFPVHEDDEVIPCFVQVLAVQPKVTCVDTCKVNGATDRVLSVAVQQLEPHTSLHQDYSLLSTAEIVDVFIFSDETPKEIDFAQCKTDQRAQYLQWSPSPSSTPGCTALGSPRPLTVPDGWDLMHDKIPALSLLDALEHTGWEAQSSVVHHSSESPRVYDRRKALSKKSYLKCLVFAPELFAAGIEFKSSQSQGFFKYILRHKRLPAADLSNNALQKLLQNQDTGSGDDEEAYFPVRPVVPVPVPVEDVHDEDIALGLDYSVPKLLPLPAPPPAPEPLSAPPPEPLPEPLPAPEDDDISEPIELAVPHVPGTWPARFEGIVLKQISGRESLAGGHSYSTRLSLKCPSVDHCSCQRTRSTTLCTKELGREAALCYLGVWAEHWYLDEAQHRKFQPSMTQMREYKERRLHASASVAAG